jgi:hypothetical protein
VASAVSARLRRKGTVIPCGSRPAVTAPASVEWAGRYLAPALSRCTRSDGTAAPAVTRPGSRFRSRVGLQRRGGRGWCARLGGWRGSRRGVRRWFWFRRGWGGGCGRGGSCRACRSAGSWRRWSRVGGAPVRPARRCARAAIPAKVPNSSITSSLCGNAAGHAVRSPTAMLMPSMDRKNWAGRDRVGRARSSGMMKG